MRFSDAQCDRIRKRLAMARARFEHPWSALTKTRGANAGPIRIVGYGSLVSPASAAETLGSVAVRECVPVVAFGVRRLFNYSFPLGSTRYGPIREGPERAALNVQITGSFGQALNGVLFQLDPSDVAALARRERGYDLVRIPYVHWSSPEATPGWAWILSAPDTRRGGRRYTDDGILPFGPYLRTCSAGAASWGPEFLEYWFETTFLADGSTRVRGWEPRAK